MFCPLDKNGIQLALSSIVARNKFRFLSIIVFSGISLQTSCENPVPAKARASNKVSKRFIMIKVYFWGLLCKYTPS